MKNYKVMYPPEKKHYKLQGFLKNTVPPIDVIRMYSFITSYTGKNIIYFMYGTFT
jgi:hypothetical protein